MDFNFYIQFQFFFFFFSFFSVNQIRPRIAVAALPAVRNFRTTTSVKSDGEDLNH